MVPEEARDWSSYGQNLYQIAAVHQDADEWPLVRAASEDARRALERVPEDRRDWDLYTDVLEALADSLAHLGDTSAAAIVKAAGEKARSRAEQN